MLRGLLLVLPLTVAAHVLARVPGLGVLGPLGLALLVAIGFRAAFGLPRGSEPGVRLFARPLLRVGIVLLGVRLDFRQLVAAGPDVLIVDGAVVLAGTVAGFWLGTWLGVRRPLSLLLGVGTAICGASAIAASGPIVRANEDDVAVSIGLISLLGTIGVVAYPTLAGLLGLSDPAYALWCGATLHEVPQVLAASFARGEAAGDLATLVKLARVALLAPVALALAAFEARRSGETISLRHLPVPGFLLGFLTLGAARSVGLVPDFLVPLFETASRLLLVAAMAAVGLGVHLDAVRRLGWRALALGVAVWAVVLGVALAAAVATGFGR